ncbi:unnamed protein product [Bursaphelenchus xylophilus]|uniref:(pine wood nematode) hypothetical protein n=1 Tax=Bursaphelenchus xylophilus TaxID=6326 RepID=A0A1I7SSC1_BURXY|nr:unnamed protein product [Bursaphelenchus xylophilus]CAG9097753.1 unnamed protein product [Bursaphelenchus xylophilus]
MAFSECHKKLIRTSLRVSDDLKHVNSLFRDVLIEYLFEDILVKLKGIVANNFSTNNSIEGPVLLKVLGTCSDVDLLLSVVYKNLEASNIDRLICNGSKSPFHLLGEAVKINENGRIPLIFVVNSVKFKYSLALLDGLLTEEVKSILIMFCNESQSFNLPAVIEQSIVVEYFNVKNPTNAVKDVLYRFFCLLPEKLGLFLGGDLLLEMMKRFTETRQSFMDMEVVISTSISQHLMNLNTTTIPESTSKISTYLAVLKAFSVFLRMAEILPKYQFRSVNGHESLGFYIDLHNEEDYIDNVFKQIHGSSRLKRKEEWLKFFEQVEGLFDINNGNGSSDMGHVLAEIKKLKEDVLKTEVMSATDLMKENLNKSPSRRKPIKEHNYFADVVNDVHKMFKTHLKKLPKSHVVNLAPVFNPAKEVDVPKDPVLRDLIECGCI